MAYGEQGVVSRFGDDGESAHAYGVETFERKFPIADVKSVPLFDGGDAPVGCPPEEGIFGNKEEDAGGDRQSGYYLQKSLVHCWLFRYFACKSSLKQESDTIRQNEIMDALAIIDKYYPEENELKHILLVHSRSVADKALQIADRHPELNLDRQFLEEAALLHDIGIFLTSAPDICCFGDKPYICHGSLGAELMRREGYPRHALVCERHTGAGLSLAQIEREHLPVPHREMVPVSLEEQVICFADKFFSKTRLDREKSLEKALRSLEPYGKEGVARFKSWCERFL